MEYLSVAVCTIRYLPFSSCRDSALAMSRINFEFIKGQLRDGDGNYHVKSLKTDIVTSPIEMLLSKVGHYFCCPAARVLITFLTYSVGQSLITPNQ